MTGSTAPAFAIGAVSPMLAVHGLDDFFQVRSPGAAPDWWQACAYVFQAVDGWWLLRHYASPDALAPQDAAPTDDDEHPEAAAALD
ncbi:hypothetical protein SAMN06272735_9087 [Streptomyces sp. TLI_55]|uniref:hypothetical protein n=1 Tax=Streptomyces sp. TLI_55 TaxID=1938861 RepID=UPI000BDC3607|nr:hypothetical protein [Streptomyces sp. TLI_55]SNX88614.1 hypothetical protein SAMN06272735_9087 [Streptomyces sp. TLI_55]